MTELIYNAENQILGRLASVVAKRLLEGERVVVVNVEKAVIGGSRRAIIEFYKQRRRRGDPYHGPFFPRTPEGIFRRAVRGMLPWHKAKGRQAFKRLKVYASVPEKFAHRQLIKAKGCNASKLKIKCISLAEIARELGYETKAGAGSRKA